MALKQIFQHNFTSLNISRLKRLDQFLILLSSILFLGNIIGLIIYMTRINQSSSRITTSVKAMINKKITAADSIKIVKTPLASLEPNLQGPDIYGTTMQFTSYELGLRFNYLTHWWSKTDSIEDSPTDIYISRSSNKVCITHIISKNSENCVDGQYILLFKKDIKTSFQEIIQEEILNDNNKDCAVNIRKSGDKEIAEIVPLTDKCSNTYIKGDANRYFQYDDRFPNRFVFISLNQTPFFADTHRNTWEMTLELF